ncbi:LADA_0A00540g1_1 [Lachancea dasiensis]|uniref:LADA_0A00540g1_1 n=1 Tax=Lachancea dasiensis TaxID=1072105 RepID=A0A1G4ILK1_9SACH|nr:LADA_0A00540g1_1 [Lachancea dasiensis]
MLSKCCFTGNLHEGESIGEIKELFGLKTYVTGSASNDKIVIILTDVFGLKLVNNRLIADQIGKAGYKVLIPDILFGDPVTALDGSVDFKDYAYRHRPEVTRPIIDGFLHPLKKELNPKFLGVIGHCFGGRYVLDLIQLPAPLADAAAIAHPSSLENQKFENIGQTPLLISAAQVDRSFNTEARHTAEKILSENGAVFQVDLFSNVSHGFAVRGDITDAKVKYAKEKVLSDQIHWFDHFSRA